MIQKILPSGAEYLRIPHSADPSKDDAWLEMVRQQMLDTPDLFERHILMNDQVVSGTPVFPTYEDEWHCPPKFRETGIPIIPQSLYFGGWDCGQTINPAFTLIQVPPKPFQAHAILEVTSQGAESMQQFAPRVWQAVERRIPGYFDQVRHYADATVTTRSGTDLRTAKQEAAKHGFEGPLGLKPVSNAFGPRRSAVNWLLSRKIEVPIDGQTVVVPGFMVDAKHCPMLRQALRGQYQWKVNHADGGPAGQVYMEPLKNMWSHVAEALQYAGVKIRRMIEPGQELFKNEEEDEMIKYFKSLKKRSR